MRWFSHLCQYCGAVSWLPAVTVFAMWLPAVSVSVYPLHPCNVTFGSSHHPECTKSIAFKTVDSHSPRLASCTMLEQMKSEEVFLLISDFHFESRAVLSISPLTFHQNQNIPAGSALREVLLKFWVRENIFLILIYPGKQLRIDSYLQMQAEIHLGSWDFLPFLYTNGALVSGKVL